MTSGLRCGGGPSRLPRAIPGAMAEDGVLALAALARATAWLLALHQSLGANKLAYGYVN